MLLHYEHEFDTLESPEDVRALMMASRFSERSFSYLPKREPDGARVILRPKYEFGKGGMPLPEILIEPEPKEIGTRVRLRARPVKWLWGFFLFYMAWVTFFFVMSLLMLCIRRSAEEIPFLLISAAMGAGCYAMLFFCLRGPSKSLFQKIEREINGNTTYQ